MEKAIKTNLDHISEIVKILEDVNHPGYISEFDLKKLCIESSTMAISALLTLDYLLSDESESKFYDIVDLWDIPKVTKDLITTRFNDLRIQAKNIIDNEEADYTIMSKTITILSNENKNLVDKIKEMNTEINEIKKSIAVIKKAVDESISDTLI